MSSKLRLIALLPLMTVAGCANGTAEIGSPDPAFGEAVKYDMAIQVIDPDPVYDENGAQPGDSGAIGAAAVERYRKGGNLLQHNKESRQGSAISTTGSSGGGSAPQ